MDLGDNSPFPIISLFAVFKQQKKRKITAEIGGKLDKVNKRSIVSLSLCMPVTPAPGVGGLSQAAGFPSAEEPASCCSTESFVFHFLVNPKCASRFACLLLDMRNLLFSTEIERFFNSYLYLKIK